MPYFGEGRKRILVVNSAPSDADDAAGRPLSGESGAEFRNMLRGVGIHPRDDIWATHAVACHPTKKKSPLDAVDHCRPLLLKTIQELKPTTILTLGALAAKSVIGMEWRSGLDGGLERWMGWRIPSRRFNAWVCPLGFGVTQKRTEPQEYKIRQIQLEMAIACSESHPWDKIPIPDEQGMVKLLHDPDEINAYLEMAGKSKQAVAFDYETTSLKPDGASTRIFSMSLSVAGGAPVAFLVNPAIKAAMQNFLWSKTPKVAANMKFEDRWTRKTFGKGVRNWVWDTMQAAHVLDSRDGITGLKFQAFVNFGMPDYSEEVHKYLTAPGTRALNRIDQAPTRKLLVYNGVDSYAEYHLAVWQIRQLGAVVEGF